MSHKHRFKKEKVQVNNKVSGLTQKGKVVRSNGDWFWVQWETGSADKTTLVESRCTPSGKIRMNNITILVGDSVEIEVSVHDLTKGRVTRRYDPRRLLQEQAEAAATQA